MFPGFSRRHNLLALRRDELRLHSSMLRLDTAQQAAQLQPAMHGIDRVADGLRWLQQHIGLAVLSTVGVLMLRPKRGLRLVAGLWWGWRTWRKSQRVIRVLLSLR